MIRKAAVIIPTLDEEAHIGALLHQLGRVPDSLLVEILVADGGSRDATRALVTQASQVDGRVRLIENPARIQSAGINRAAAAAHPSANTFVRIDAHSEYPDDYVERILSSFASTPADMIAVRLDTVGTTCLQRGIAAASNSRVGTGGSAHRVGGFSGYVDHGHHAGMDRAIFDRIGGYDVTFEANEDAELDYRVRREGGLIWLAGDIAVTYFPRRTLGALFRQYRRYGSGRARTFLKHGERLRIRQMLPPIMVAGTIGALLLSPLIPVALAIPILYVIAVAVVGLRLAIAQRSSCALLAAPAMVTMHMAWGIGFIAHMLCGIAKRRQGDFGGEITGRNRA